MNGTKTFFAAFALALLAFAGFASASVNPKVQLLNYTVSEVPAQPGHVVALTLHLKSMESDNCAERVAVQLTVAYPLSLRGSDTQYVDSLCFRDPETKGDFTFYLPVDNLATSGTYPVIISTTYEKRYTKLSESNTINLQVGGDAIFDASVTSSAPVDIYAGDSAKVTVTFQNRGSSMVQSAKAGATASGISVKWAGREQNVGEIAARGSASATFEIEAPKGISAGSYPLRVSLDYIGENRSAGNAGFTFMVPIKPKAEFAATTGQDALRAGEKREVAITFTNIGNEEAKKMKVRIKPLFPFSTDGTVRYVESLPAGASTNMSYMITVDKDATPGGQLLGFIVDFEDPQGKQLSDNADFAMNVRTATIVDDIIGLWYLWAIIVIAAVVMITRKKKPAAG